MSDSDLSSKTMKIAIAAFLHDIGKFAQRSRGDSINPGDPAFYPSQEFLDNHRAGLQPFNQNEQKYTHEHAIYTAAFIDHLEAILPDCFNDNEWGGKAWIAELAAGHHLFKEDECGKQPFMRWAISVADRLASSLDRSGAKEFEKSYNLKEDIKNFRCARQWPIMEAIKIREESNSQQESSFKYRIPLAELAEDKFFPDTKEKVVPENNNEAQKQYRELFYKFYEELQGLKQFKNNVQLWFAQFDNLYMRYAGQIPAATVGNAMQDISLYDHSKITAAIATALYLYHDQTGKNTFAEINAEDEKKLLFIGTSFFGIQKFIFASGAQTNKNAAKILRGRSFYVSLFSEAIADWLLKETGLPVTSIIFNAAGQVTILAPNLPYIIEAVKKVKEEANKWLLNRFYGQTSLGIAYTEVSQDEIGFKYREIWNNFSIRMEEEKYCKFDLPEFGGTQKQFFNEFDDKMGVCPFCGKRPAKYYTENERIPACGVCKDQITMGAKLVKADAIVLWEKDKADFEEKLCEPIFGKYNVWLGGLGEAVNNALKSDIRFLARLTNSNNETEWRKVAYRPLKAYVPCDDEGKIIDFGEIAEKAVTRDIRTDEEIGVEALGVLKADVDNLGKIFGLGLKSEIQTLTRTSVLSRQFNNFFAVYLPYLLETKYPNIYTVFAGGDDLFLIGPHNEILDLAPVIRKKFREFVCNNPDVTISMGISVHKPGEPVKSMAEAAEEALETAKASKGKDSICVFGEVVKWDKFEKLSVISDKLREWVEKGDVNTGILYKFNTAVEELAKEQLLKNKLMEHKKVSFAELANALSWKARLKYSLIRSQKSTELLKTGDELARIADLENMIGWLEDYKSSVRIPLWKEIYRRRKH